jgi:hypothetical protein
MVLSASEVTMKPLSKWPLYILQKENDTYPINDFDYMKARVQIGILTFLLALNVANYRSKMQCTRHD